MRTKSLVALLIAHISLSIASFLWVYSLGSSHFDGRPVSSLAFLLARFAKFVFWFPFAGQLFDLIRFSSFLGWVPVVINSSVVVAGVVFVHKRLSHRGKSSAKADG